MHPYYQYIGELLTRRNFLKYYDNKMHDKKVEGNDVCGIFPLYGYLVLYYYCMVVYYYLIEQVVVTYRSIKCMYVDIVLVGID